MARGAALWHRRLMDTTARYDAAAPGWDRKITALGYDAAYRRFLATNVLPAGRVLDAGTGSGAFARAWLAAGGSPDLTLMDPSPSMLLRADAAVRAHGVAPRLVETTIEAYCPDRTYAVILAAHVVEHAANPVLAFRCLADWLEPQGRLLLVVSRPHWCNLLLWPRYRHRWFSAKRICDLGRTAGLHPVSSHAFAAGPPSRTSRGHVFLKP